MAKETFVFALALLVANALATSNSSDNTTTTTVGPSSTVPPTESVVGELKTGILAGGWIPFSIVLLLSCFFSFTYVRYYQHRREREAVTTVVSILALIVALLTTALVPVDIFLVSSFKSSDGTFHDWASDSIRSEIKNTITDGYYAMYALNCLFVFIVMPMAYFFFEEKDEVAGMTTRARCMSALKFTSGTVVVLGVLLCIGAFALNSDGTACAGTANSTDIKDQVKCRATYAEESLAKNGGTNSISFTMGVLSVIGMLYFGFYTGLGLVALPASLMQSRDRTSDMDLQDNTSRVRVNRDKQDSLRAKYQSREKKMSNRDRDELVDHEDEERVLINAQRDLETQENSWVAKTARCCRPFSMVFGILLILLSTFLVICLLLSSVDRLTQITSQGLNFKTGYSEAAPRLMNPIDKMLTLLQQAFPMDYIALTLLVFFLVLATAQGIVHLGVRFCFMKAFRVQSGKTVPQGLLCLVSILMFTVLALNIVLLTLAPQYTTYGNQRYATPADGASFGAWPGQATSLCDSTAPQYVFYAYNETARYITNKDYSVSGQQPNQCADKIVSQFNQTGATLDLSRMGCSKITACESTRLSALLHAFFYNAWFFGAIYYWANWLFIVVFFISVIFFVSRKRQSALQQIIKEHKTNFDDDEPIAQFNPKWMR